MALKAFAVVQDTERNGSDNTKVDINIRVNVLGSDIGNLEGPTYNFYAYGFTVGDLAGLKAAIKAAVKADMEGHGITFTPIVDTVDLYA